MLPACERVTHRYTYIEGPLDLHSVKSKSLREITNNMLQSLTAAVIGDVQ